MLLYFWHYKSSVLEARLLKYFFWRRDRWTEMFGIWEEFAFGFGFFPHSWQFNAFSFFCLIFPFPWRALLFQKGILWFPTPNMCSCLCCTLSLPISGKLVLQPLLSSFSTPWGELMVSSTAPEWEAGMKWDPSCETFLMFPSNLPGSRQNPWQLSPLLYLRLVF